MLRTRGSGVSSLRERGCGKVESIPSRRRSSSGKEGFRTTVWKFTGKKCNNCGAEEEFIYSYTEAYQRVILLGTRECMNA